MTRRVAMWVVAGVVFGVLSLVTVPAPGGVFSLASAGHLGMFWAGFVAVALLDIFVLRHVKIGRRP